MKKFAVVCSLLPVLFAVGAFFALRSTADAQSELQALVGKWVWNQRAVAPQARPFTTTLTITDVSPDGAFSGTYSGFRVASPISVSGRATATKGKIKVAFSVPPLVYDLDYTKDTLRGSVSGLPLSLVVREADFQREK